MKALTFYPPIVRCWRRPAVRSWALVLCGLWLASASLSAAAEVDPAALFVAPAGHAQPVVVLAAAMAPVAAPVAATPEPAFIPPATRLSAPAGQPKRLQTPEAAAIEFISPASREVCAPFSLINPVESPPRSAQPATSTMVSTAPVADEASPLETAIPGIPEFDFDDLAEPVSPTSVMQPAEEVASPAGVPAAAPAAGPMDPLEFNRRYYRPITAVTIDAALPEGLAPGGPGSETKNPASPPMPEFTDARFYNGWPQSGFPWAATCFCHRPLYFEEVNLERYGYTVNPVLQPFISGAHFFATIPALPYKMTRHCPHECIYTLGHYRPGDCGVPRRWHHELWDPTAGLVEGGVVTGLIFLVP